MPRYATPFGRSRSRRRAQGEAANTPIASSLRTTLVLRLSATRQAQGVHGGPHGGAGGAAPINKGDQTMRGSHRYLLFSRRSVRGARPARHHAWHLVRLLGLAALL